MRIPNPIPLSTDFWRDLTKTFNRRQSRKTQSYRTKTLKQQPKPLKTQAAKPSTPKVPIYYHFPNDIVNGQRC